MAHQAGDAAHADAQDVWKQGDLGGHLLWSVGPEEADKAMSSTLDIRLGSLGIPVSAWAALNGLTWLDTVRAAIER